LKSFLFFGVKKQDLTPGASITFIFLLAGNSDNLLAAELLVCMELGSGQFYSCIPLN
jgi:hypothetical protein